PRDAEHAHVARAPRLGGDPGEDLERVPLLLWEVLVRKEAVRLARAADVHAQHRVTVPGEVRVPGLVAAGRAVALAIGEVLEDGGDRVVLGVLGEPDPRAQPDAVGQRDPDVVHHPHRARQVFHDLHRGSGTPDSSSACWSSRGAGRARGPAVPSTLKRLPSSRTAPTPGCSTVWTSPLAFTCGSSNSWSRLRTSLAGT